MTPLAATIIAGIVCVVILLAVVALGHERKLRAMHRLVRQIEAHTEAVAEYGARRHTDVRTRLDDIERRLPAVPEESQQ